MGKINEIMHRGGQKSEKNLSLNLNIKRLTGCIEMGKDRITEQNHRKNTIVWRVGCRIPMRILE